MRKSEKLVQDILDLLSKYGVVKYNAASVGTTKRMELHVRRALHELDIAHSVTVSNKGKGLLIWLTAKFKARKTTPDVVAAVTEDNTLDDESVRPELLALEELNLKIKQREGVVGSEVDQKTKLLALTKAQFDKGIITKETYEALTHRIREEVNE